jgi:hypothetical protein
MRRVTMNKERVLKVVSIVNMGSLMTLGVICLYFAFTVEMEDFLKGFLQGVGGALVVFAPIAFSKWGFFYKMMSKFDERQFFIQIITLYIMMLLLFIVTSRLFVQYIAYGEISFLQLNIKLVLLIVVKLLTKKTLDNYL